MSLPFGLSNLFKPLSPSIAKTRLKSNLFILFLFIFGKNFFSPYITIKNGLIKLSDNYLQHRKFRGTGREGSWADGGFYLFEFLVSAILVWNIVEAAVSIQYPQTYVPEIKQNLVLTPSKVSSPLTRSYSPSPSSTKTSSSAAAQPSSQSLQRSIYRSSPTSTPIRSQQLSNSTSSNLNQSQSQSHPLSNSISNSSPSKTTAQLFNLPINNNSPSKSGLFFEKKDIQQQNQNQSQGGGVGGDFVLVDREEKLWVDNVLKGVRGKGGKVNL